MKNVEMANEMSMLFGQLRSLKRHLLFRVTKHGEPYILFNAKISHEAKNSAYCSLKHSQGKSVD